MATESLRLPSTWIKTALFAALVLAITATPAAGHSVLSHPKPYTPQLCKGCQTCRRFSTINHKLRNTAKRPAATWKRGQKVTIRWLKNNHEGGFVRLSLVPIAKMFSAKAHDKFAFYHGCWEQQVHKCGSLECGSDTKGIAFRRAVRVPTVVPDGVYVLSYMWYGGISESRRSGRYGDYTSCSFVRIRGGRKVVKAFRPYFKAGHTGKFETKPAGRCYTSAVNTHDCRLGCEKRGVWADIPQAFQKGRRPQALTPNDFRRA